MCVNKCSGYKLFIFQNSFVWGIDQEECEMVLKELVLMTPLGENFD